MTRIVVVYHSKMGRTAAQARAIAKGAADVENTTVLLLPIEDVERNWDELNTADAIIFGSPTYMGGVTGQFKMFMDSTGRIQYNHLWKDKIAAGFTHSSWVNGDKLNTLMQLVIFAAQHGMHWVSAGENPSQISEEHVNRLGSWVGSMAQSQRGSAEPPTGDMKTAELLGKRVAEVTRQWVRGRQALAEEQTPVAVQ